MPDELDSADARERLRIQRLFQPKIDAAVEGLRGDVGEADTWEDIKPLLAAAVAAGFAVGYEAGESETRRLLDDERKRRGLR